MKKTREISYNEVVGIIYKEYKWIYTREQVKKLIEENGANSLNPHIHYKGFGIYEITR